MVIAETPFIVGLYTCSCHPFGSYDEAQVAQRQKLPVGLKVKNRCSGRIGIIYEIIDKGYVTVRYGPLPKNIELEHVQNLLNLKQYGINFQ